MPGAEKDENTTSKNDSQTKFRRDASTADANFEKNDNGTKSTLFEGNAANNELATKLDEVINHEDHRLKGGRDLKRSV